MEQTCSKCLLSTRDTRHIEFDKEGICSYCRFYDEKMHLLGSAADRKKILEDKIEQIKIAGKHKKYDCIIGLSGGTDSSYMALLVKEFGLRPLVIHLDNGWNTDTAVKNIENICEKLDYDLYTYVIDWEEFAALQRAYLRAGVVDIEVLTDHAIYAITYKLARKFGIQYTLSGYNYATEAIMPKGWTFSKRDFLNIRDIVGQYGNGFRFKTYPYISFYKALYYFWFHKLESFQLLNYLDFNKEQAKEVLKSELGWKDYGGKHYESVFTKFYQSYILPNKFGIDKRKAHLSNLICSGQIGREEALKELAMPLYKPRELEEEKAYVLKKLNLSEEEFQRIMNEAPRAHSEFKSDQILWNRYFRFVSAVKRIINPGVKQND